MSRRPVFVRVLDGSVHQLDDSDRTFADAVWSTREEEESSKTIAVMATGGSSFRTVERKWIPANMIALVWGGEVVV